jgi:3-oxo-5-alpha-steroid 4-dehydrogenase 1
MNLETFNLICIIWAIVGVVSFIVLQFVTAPYGKHIKKGWGPEISNKFGWMIMELPSFLIIMYFFLISGQSSYAKMLSVLWLIHYFNRSFIYPLRIRTKGKKIPMVIVISAIFFNLINGGLNGYFLSTLEQYNDSSFQNWNFYIGIIIFIVSFVINQISDNILIHLRKPGEIGYKIPKGFLFKYISCPNHLSELLQWTGFAIMAWNYPAFCFLIWTAANLLPRSARHHKWYREHFDSYPKNRKALLPKLW